MHTLIEKYGKQAMDELLDTVIITQKPSDDWFEAFAKRHEILSRKSRATVRGYMGGNLITKEYQRINGMTRYMEIEEPYTRYTIWAKNGRGEFIFHIDFTSKEIPQIREELNQTETTL